MTESWNCGPCRALDAGVLSSETKQSWIRAGTSPWKGRKQSTKGRTSFKTLLLRLSILAAIYCWSLLTATGAPFTFSSTGSMAAVREFHTATLLTNGKVLVAGGTNSNGILASAELYDPASGTWSATGSLNTARFSHTATLLPNGKVLVAGGGNSDGALASAEVYDPASGTWTASGSLAAARETHTATLLPNGKVLLAGGSNAHGGILASAEVYDPANGTWMGTGALVIGPAQHTATLLPNGKVLVAGGNNGGVSLVNAQLYDPASGAWSATASLGTARVDHTATLLPSGKVLVAGGQNSTNGNLASAEVYDPATGKWTATGSLANARNNHAATLLPDGRVLVAGGFNGFTLGSAELYDPANGTWSTTGSLGAARVSYTATVLPNGAVLVAGGNLASAELYDSASGTWTATGSLNTGREVHTATLLPNGKVLVAGGFNGIYLASAELYDPGTGTWTATGSLGTARASYTATLLPNGKVLVAGGVDNNNVELASAELYDPASGSWTATGSLNTARAGYTATLLPNGKVLFAGGFDNNVVLASAELYDPATGTWAATGSLNTARDGHTATLLPNGKVLVAGGTGNSVAALASAELYDSANGTWTTTASLGVARYGHTATLLPNGKVLVAGGFNSIYLASAELYDPGTGTWTATGSLGTARAYYTATLLPSGKVLVAGGFNIGSSGGVSLANAELYDSASGTWTATGSLGTARSDHRATLLPNGKVLVAGGSNSTSSHLTSAELYDMGLGFIRPDWQPQIATATSTLALGSTLMLTGSRFRGISQASGGNTQDSSTNYPVVQLRSIIGIEQTVFLPVDPIAGWSNTAFTSAPVTGFPVGPAMVTVFVNGIPSDASFLMVAPPTVLANISTRLLVGTGDNVLIAGFIVTGNQNKKVIIRAIGPSLTLPGKLVDPVLELHDSSGALLEMNDNWMDSQNKQAIIDSTIPPTNPLESAIVRSVAPGTYTAIERGVGGGTGIGVVEVYDLDTSANSKLANISTRGLVQTGDNVLFAGTIVVGQSSQKVIIRALGPSTGVPGAMADPTLELHDGNGALLEANDNWMDSPNKQAIIDSTIPPPNNLESAIVRTLTPANYTAIVRGANNTTGIAVVEIYELN